MVSNRKGFVPLAILVIGLVVACGDDGENGDAETESESSGLDPSKPLVDLSDGEKQQLCSWTASVQEAKTCPDGSTTEPPTAAECTAQLANPPATCTATVSESESCATVDPCDFEEALMRCAVIFGCSDLGG